MVWKFKLSVAWLNLVHNPRKLVVSLNGIIFSVVLMFMFTGFKNALYDSQLVFLSKLRGELFLLSKSRPTFASVELFPRRVLYQIQSWEEVEQVDPLYSGYAFWKNPDTKDVALLRVIAFNPLAPVIDFSEVETHRAKLLQPGTVLMDTKSLPTLGPRDVGVVTELENRKVEIIGIFELGTDFASINGNVITSDQNFLRYFTGRDPKQGDRNLDGVDLGIIQLTPGTDPIQMAITIRHHLPEDVTVMTRTEFLEWERRYWQENTNIGFIFGLLTTMGFVVGIVLVYQVLYADITNNWSEYATLKAIGYKNVYLLRVILEEAILLSVLGFIPGLAISSVLLNLTGGATGLLFRFTFSRIIQIYLFTLSMALISGCIAVFRVQQADPAEIF